jgi:hypothetical protein
VAGAGAEEEEEEEEEEWSFLAIYNSFEASKH